MISNSEGLGQNEKKIYLIVQILVSKFMYSKVSNR